MLAEKIIKAPSRLFLVATCLCCQLKMPVIDDADSNLVTQNIVFAICGVHSLMGQIACIDPRTFWFTLEQHEKDQFLKAFDLIDSKKGRRMFMSSSFTSSVYDSNNQLNVENIQYVVVVLLLRKMGKIALQMDVIQADNLKKLAEDTCGKIENILGTQNFVQVYNLIRKNLKLKRNKRKQEEKLMVVINPMRNAKRKSRIAAKHRANKKRMIITLKLGRWMH